MSSTNFILRPLWLEPSSIRSIHDFPNHPNPRQEPQLFQDEAAEKFDPKKIDRLNAAGNIVRTTSTRVGEGNELCHGFTQGRCVFGTECGYCHKMLMHRSDPELSKRAIPFYDITLGSLPAWEAERHLHELEKYPAATRLRPNRNEFQYPRHDNDHEDYRNVITYPTSRECIAASVPSYIPTPIFPSSPQYSRRAYIDAEFRILRESEVAHFRNCSHHALQDMLRCIKEQRTPNWKYAAECSIPDTQRAYNHYRGLEFCRDSRTEALSIDEWSGKLTIKVRFNTPCDTTSQGAIKPIHFEPGAIVALVAIKKEHRNIDGYRGSVTFMVVDSHPRTAYAGKTEVILSCAQPDVQQDIRVVASLAAGVLQPVVMSLLDFRSSSFKTNSFNLFSHILHLAKLVDPNDFPLGPVIDDLKAGTEKTKTTTMIEKIVTDSRASYMQEPEVLLLVSVTNYGLDNLLQSLIDAGVGKVLRLGKESKHPGMLQYGIDYLQKHEDGNFRMAKYTRAGISTNAARHNLVRKMTDFTQYLSARSGKASTPPSFWVLENYLKEMKPNVVSQFTFNTKSLVGAVVAKDRDHAMTLYWASVTKLFEKWWSGDDLQNTLHTLQVVDTADDKDIEDTTQVQVIKQVRYHIAKNVRRIEKDARTAKEDKVWLLSPPDRRRLAEELLHQQGGVPFVIDEFVELYFRYRHAAAKFDELVEVQDAELAIRDQRTVIACTMAGFQTYYSMLEKLNITSVHLLEAATCPRLGEQLLFSLPKVKQVW